MRVSHRIEQQWNLISSTVKIAFFSSLLVGLIVHLSGITNHFLNHDSLIGIQGLSNRAQLVQGKWFSGVFYQIFGGNITNTETYFVIAILFLSICAGITVCFLQVKSNISAMLIGALMVTFPSVVATNSYVAASIVFFGALLLACLCVFFADHGRIGLFVSIIFMTLSLGTYQAMISYAVGLFILKMILESLKKTYSTKECILRGLKYILILVAAIILYYILLKTILFVTGVELGTYRGISQMESIQIWNIPNLIKDAYAKVFKFFLFDSYGENTTFTAWLYRGIILCGITNYLALIKKTGLYKDKVRVLLSVTLVLLLPLAVHIIAVLGQNINTHWCMIYAFVLIPIAVIVFADLNEYVSPLANTEDDTNHTKRGLKETGISALIVLTLALGFIQGWKWFMITGECYTALRYSNSAAYAAGVQLSSKLTDMGYENSIPLALVGDRITPFKVLDEVVFSKSQYTGIMGPEFIWDASHMYAYLKNIIGLRFTPASTLEIEIVSNKYEVIFDMPIYPAEGSIRVIDGIMVVKMSDIEYDMIKEVKAIDSEQNKIVEYGDLNYSLKITADKGQSYIYTSIFSFTEPNATYSLSCRNVKRVTGDTETVELLLYQMESKKVVASKVFPIDEGFTYIFTTSEWVSDAHGKNFELLLYAGERGKTENNTILYEGLILERVS